MSGKENRAVKGRRDGRNPKRSETAVTALRVTSGTFSLQAIWKPCNRLPLGITVALPRPAHMPPSQAPRTYLDVGPKLEPAGLNHHAPNSHAQKPSCSGNCLLPGSPECQVRQCKPMCQLFRRTEVKEGQVQGGPPVHTLPTSVLGRGLPGSSQPCHLKSPALKSQPLDSA